MASEQEQPDARAEAAAFFRAEYRGLHAAAGYIGATTQEAHDAVMAVMPDMIKNWEHINSPRAYARRAVLNKFIQGRERERRRLRRLIEQRNVSNSASAEEVGLADWEGRQWVMQKLRSLPPRQREVLALIVDGLSPAEASQVLGRNGDAVRQSLREARRRLVRELEAEGFTTNERSTRAMGKEAP